MIDHYRVLGVRRTADGDEIRRAYLRLARVHHPDQHVGAASAERRRHEESMRAINRAWEILGDPERRAAYDLAGSARPDGGGASPAGRTGVRMPAGRRWTPQADDRAWMDDFAAWRADDGRLPEDPPGRGMGPIAVLPSLLLGLAIVIGFVGVALSARPLMAIAFGAAFLSVMIFVLLSIRELGRSRSVDRGGRG